MEKPDVDLIEGLSPAISIEQKSTSHNPRSTVGTVTEIYDYLRLLFARVGEPRCPNHGVTLAAQTVSQMVDHVLQLPEGAKLMLLAPLVDDRKGEHAHVLDTLRAQGYVRARIDDKVVSLDEVPELKKNFKHTIEAVVDRLAVKPDQGQRLAESFETAIHLGEGLVRVVVLNEDNSSLKKKLFSRHVTPARTAATRSPSSNPDYFRSTTPPAPARPATASACASFSTRRASSPMPRCRCRRAPSAAGTGAMRFTTRCSNRSRATTPSASIRHSKTCPKKCAT